MNDVLDELLQVLQKDPTKKRRLIEILSLDDEYTRKDDLKPLIQELIELRLEQVRLREDMNKRFEAVDRRFEAIDRRFEAVDKRFEAVDKRFEAVDKRFDQLIKAMEKGFESLHYRMDKLEKEVRRMGGVDLELLSLTWFRGLLEAKGYSITNLKWRIKFPDPDLISNHSEVEIDIFQDKPLTIVEVTSFVTELKKIENLFNKKQFIEHRFGKEPITILVTYGIDKSIEKSAITLLESHNIQLLSIGTKLDDKLLETD